MKPDVLSKLERLTDLRDRGGLTDHEYQAQKAALLSRPEGRSRSAVVVIGILVAAALVAALGSWAALGVWPAKRPPIPSPQEFAQTSPAPRSLPTAADKAKIPAPTLETIFRLVYPSRKTVLRWDGESYQVSFSPAALVRVDEDTFALVSTAKDVVNDCHACQGFYSIAYVGTYPALVKEGEPYIGAGSIGGWGQPPEVAAITSLSPKPMILVKGSTMAQGIVSEYGTLIALGDRISDLREVTEGFELSYDDSGKPGTCQITGRISPLAYGKTLQIRYSGSWQGRSVFAVNGYRAKADVELWKKCPDYEE